MRTTWTCGGSPGEAKGYGYWQCGEAEREKSSVHILGWTVFTVVLAILLLDVLSLLRLQEVGPGCKQLYLLLVLLSGNPARTAFKLAPLSSQSRNLRRCHFVPHLIGNHVSSGAGVMPDAHLREFQDQFVLELLLQRRIHRVPLYGHVEVLAEQVIVTENASLL